MDLNYIIDTHTHIDMLEGITADDAVKNAFEYGVKKLVLPTSRAEDIDIVNELSLKFDNVYALLGVHPSEICPRNFRDKAEGVSESFEWRIRQRSHGSACDEQDEQVAENCFFSGWNACVADKIRTLVKHNKKIVGIGEIGLDYHWDDSNKDEQKSAFIEQIKLANELNLPICVHDRDAHKDTLDILKEYNKNSACVLHCFSGSVEFMRECVKEGYYIALGGVVTFKNAQKVREVAQEVPLERLLLETDAPFLTPEPHRGEENQPAYTKFVAEKIAQIREIGINELMRATTENAYRLYKFDEVSR